MVIRHIEIRNVSLIHDLPVTVLSEICDDLAKVVRRLRSHVIKKQFLVSLLNQQIEMLDHVHIDIVGALQYSDGLKYLLTCVDLFPCWPEAIPLVDIQAETVADAFFSGWIAHFETPVTITTNRGAQLEFRLWDNLCNQFGLIRIVQRATTLSRMAWSNVFTVNLTPPLWHTNHRSHGLSRCLQYYAALDLP